MTNELRALLDRLCEITGEHGCEISCITWKNKPDWDAKSGQRLGERMLMPFVLAMPGNQQLELRNMPLSMYLWLEPEEKKS